MPRYAKGVAAVLNSAENLEIRKQMIQCRQKKNKENVEETLVNVKPNRGSLILSDGTEDDLRDYENLCAMSKEDRMFSKKQ